MREALSSAARGEFAEPSKITVGAWLGQWLNTLRLAPSTQASYRQNVRLHLVPYIGDLALAKLTSTRLTPSTTSWRPAAGATARESGPASRCPPGPSATSTPSSALGAAVAAEPPLLLRNRAAKAKPPTAKQAAPPEMHPWSASQLAAFLCWSRENSPLHAAWWLLAMTGMRRGELLALRWRDIDLDAGTIAIRRSAGIIRNKGKGAAVVEGPTKTNKPRVIDIDAETVTLLRAWKRERGTLALTLARDDSLAFGDLEGRHLHPERFSRMFRATLTRCRKQFGDGASAEIRLHDLRHTHATLLLRDREPIKTVSERLGHSSVVVTLGVYGHVMPGDQKRCCRPVRRTHQGGVSRVRYQRCIRSSDDHGSDALTCMDIVSEGGLEPPCPIRALAPQASASAYSATRTCAVPRQ